DAEVDFLGEQPAPGDLDIAGDAAAAYPSAARRFRLARVEPGPVDRGHRLPQQRVEARALVGPVDRVPVRHLVWANEISALELHGIDAELERGLVHEPLDEITGLGPAGPAIRIDRRGMREQHAHLVRDERNVIAAVDRARAR